MSEVTLAATARPTQGGSRAATRLRAQDLIPAVVYGRGSEARAVTVARRDLRQALTGDAGVNALINLDVEGESLLTIVRDLQRDPVRNTVNHVDFILVSRDEAVTVDVPILLEGDAVEVHRHDGVVEQQLFNLTVQAKPGSIPNEMALDISALEVGDTLRVSDLALPSGVTTEVDPEEPIVVAKFNVAAAEVEAADAEAAEEASEAAEASEDEATAEAAPDADAAEG
jgi:large subunit ribosomal protein L25